MRAHTCMACACIMRGEACSACIRYVWCDSMCVVYDVCTHDAFVCSVWNARVCVVEALCMVYVDGVCTVHVMCVVYLVCM